MVFFTVNDIHVICLVDMRVKTTTAHVASTTVKDSDCVDVFSRGTIPQEALKVFIITHLSLSGEHTIQDGAVALVE